MFVRHGCGVRERHIVNVYHPYVHTFYRVTRKLQHLDGRKITVALLRSDDVVGIPHFFSPCELLRGKAMWYHRYGFSCRVQVERACTTKSFKYFPTQHKQENYHVCPVADARFSRGVRDSTTLRRRVPRCRGAVPRRGHARER